MLRDYKLVQNQHKQLAGNSYIDDDLIFDHEDGTHISSQYADDMFRSLYEPLGLPKVDLYSLRHFSITKKLDYNRHDYVSLRYAFEIISQYRAPLSGYSLIFNIAISTSSMIHFVSNKLRMRSSNRSLASSGAKFSR